MPRFNFDLIGSRVVHDHRGMLFEDCKAAARFAEELATELGVAPTGIARKSFRGNDRRTSRRTRVLRRCWMKKIFQGERGSEPEADLTRANSRSFRKLSPTLYRIGVDRHDSNTILPAVSSWRASEGQTDQPPSSPWRICRA
jgi:hypothetical protein